MVHRAQLLRKTRVAKAGFVHPAAVRSPGPADSSQLSTREGLRLELWQKDEDIFLGLVAVAKEVSSRDAVMLREMIVGLDDEIVFAIRVHQVLENLVGAVDVRTIVGWIQLGQLDAERIRRTTGGGIAECDSVRNAVGWISDRNSGRAGHNPRVPDGVTHAFIGSENEKLVSLDWTARGRSELVQPYGRNRLADWVEEVARVERIVAMKVVRRAVKFVGARFNTNIDGCSGLEAILGGWVLFSGKLLNGVQWKVRGWCARYSLLVGHCRRVVWVVVVASVYNVVVILRPIAVGGD
jgi:hypothetical protein